MLFGIGAETGAYGVPANYVGCVYQADRKRNHIASALSHSVWHHVVLTGSETGGGQIEAFSGGWLGSGVSLTTNSPYLVTATFNGASSSLTVDDTTATGNAGTSTIDAGLRLGANNSASQDFLMGDIAELIIIPNASTNSIEQTQGYLAWKWSIVGNLPADHPYRDVPPSAPPPTGTLIIIN